MAPSPRAPAATPTQTELANGHEAFHTTRRLYVDLAERFRHRPYFLPRTLSTRHKRSRYPPRARVVCVQYVSTEPGVEWARTVPALRCYWCRELFPVFKDCKDLLTHLRTCHSMLGYAVDESRAKNSVTVSVRLLRGAEGAHASSLDRYRCVDLESYYANVDKYPKYMNLPSASTSRKAVKNDQPSLREHLENRLESQAKRHASESLYNNILTYMPLPRTNNLNIPAKPAPTLSKKRKSKIRGTPAYKSIRDAAKSKRLFHSVRQQPLCVEAVENGADSDADLEEEVKWRLKMCDDEIEDYCDTIPVEKLFMNLWNQFVRVDVVFKADRVMADNCMRFAKKFRKTLIRLGLEVTFLRHLTEFYRLGLIDSDAMYEIFSVLKDRDLSQQEGEEEPQFWFANRLVQQAEKKERKERNDGWKGVLRDDVDVR